MIDGAHLIDMAQIPVDKRPVQVCLVPDGRHVYVSLNAQDRVAAFDTKARRAIVKVPAGRNPIHGPVPLAERFSNAVPTSRSRT